MCRYSGALDPNYQLFDTVEPTKFTVFNTCVKKNVQMRKCQYISAANEVMMQMNLSSIKNWIHSAK